MKQTLFIIVFFTCCASGFAQQEKLLRNQLLKTSGFYSKSYLLSAKNGDTLGFYRHKKQHLTFRRNHTIVVKCFGSTYSGDPFLEFKEKGKWHIISGGQIILLDFAKKQMELQLISTKNDFLEFLVKNQSAN